MNRARHAVLVAMLLAAGASSSPVLGEGPSQTPAESEAMTDKARDLYEEGRGLYGERAWDKAHAAFLAAWSLKKHWQIAGMLGHCDVQLGRYRDAAEHLSFAIRTGATNASPGELQALQELLSEAKRKVASVQVQVDAEAAEVLVNGRLVGTSPLFDPLFLDPGEHVFKARSGDRVSSEVSMTVGAGSAKEIMLRVDQVSQGPSAAPSVPEQHEAPATPSGDKGGGVYPILFASASALFVGGTVLGGVFWSKASGSADEVNDLRNSLPAEGCSGPVPSSDCARLSDAKDDHDANLQRRNISFAVGGVGLVAAGITGYLWMNEKPSGHALTVLPFHHEAATGIAASGTF